VPWNTLPCFTTPPSIAYVCISAMSTYLAVAAVAVAAAGTAVRRGRWLSSAAPHLLRWVGGRCWAAACVWTGATAMHRTRRMRTGGGG
jgi:hypothetical protein